MADEPAPKRFPDRDEIAAVRAEAEPLADGADAGTTRRVAGRAMARREMGKLVQDTVEYESKNLMKRLGLATRDDFTVLSTRLETLSGKIDEVVARRKVDAAETDEPVLLAADGTPVAVNG